MNYDKLDVALGNLHAALPETEGIDKRDSA